MTELFVNVDNHKNLHNTQLFQKSINGKQCISKCYEKNSKILHPIALKVVSNDKSSFCAINPTINPYNGKFLFVDECTRPNNILNSTSNNTPINKTITDIDILLPIIHFECDEFLKKCYNINNIGDFYGWLNNNKNTPYLSQLRIIDCFIKCYGNNIDILDDIFTDVIYYIIKKYWIKKMYNKLCQRVGVENNIAFLVKENKNMLKKTDYIEIRTKFLFSNLITKENIAQISSEYFSHKKGNFDIGINDYYNHLLNNFMKK